MLIKHIDQHAYWISTYLNVSVLRLPVCDKDYIKSLNGAAHAINVNLLLPMSNCFTL